MRLPKITLIMLCLIAAACSPAGTSPAATPLLITATLAPSAAPISTSAPPPATSGPTSTPIQGTTSAKLNVRGEPSSASPPLGMIDAYATVNIRGRDPSGNWYQIEFGQGTGALGWVTSQYINVQNAQAIPVVAPNGSGPAAVVSQQVNVRSQPDANSGSLGVLNARDLVVLTGKDASGFWLQIQYAGAPGGRGWVAAGYVQATGLDQLPVIGQTGQAIGTATPTGVPPTAIPTRAIARDDKDSAAAPGADVNFSPSGVTSFMYSSDLSVPTGDVSDWIRFSPYGSTVRISLDCDPKSAIKLILTLDGTALPTQTLPGCGTSATLDVASGKQYLLELSLDSSHAEPAYTQFTLRIEVVP